MRYAIILRLRKKRFTFPGSNVYFALNAPTHRASKAKRRMSVAEGKNVFILSRLVNYVQLFYFRPHEKSYTIRFFSFFFSYAIIWIHFFFKFLSFYTFVWFLKFLYFVTFSSGKPKIPQKRCYIPLLRAFKNEHEQPREMDKHTR